MKNILLAAILNISIVLSLVQLQGQFYLTDNVQNPNEVTSSNIFIPLVNETISFVITPTTLLWNVELEQACTGNQQGTCNIYNMDSAYSLSFTGDLWAQLTLSQYFQNVSLVPLIIYTVNLKTNESVVTSQNLVSNTIDGVAYGFEYDTLPLTASELMTVNITSNQIFTLQFNSSIILRRYISDSGLTMTDFAYGTITFNWIGDCATGSNYCNCDNQGLCSGNNFACQNELCAPCPQGECPCTSDGSCATQLTCVNNVCQPCGVNGIGARGCSCTSGGACNGDLVCQNKTCVISSGSSQSTSQGGNPPSSTSQGGSSQGGDTERDRIGFGFRMTTGSLMIGIILYILF